MELNPMLRLIGCLSCLAVLACASGCGKSPDDAVRSEINAMNELADMLESRDQLEHNKDQAKRKLVGADGSLKNFNLTMNDRDELFRRHDKELTATLARLRKAGWNEDLPGLRHVFGELLFPAGPGK
jgi:hypothetical protein